MQAIYIPIQSLHPFAGHPYKVQDNDEMNRLIESIQEQGILTPLIVRPLEGTAAEYEVISGHRRLRAAQKECRLRSRRSRHRSVGHGCPAIRFSSFPHTRSVHRPRATG